MFYLKAIFVEFKNTTFYLQYYDAKVLRNLINTLNLYKSFNFLTFHSILLHLLKK